MEDESWPEYLSRYHTEHAGITERLLGRAGDDSPYGWLSAPLTNNQLTNKEGPPQPEPSGSLVLDIGCGSAPTQPWLSTNRWLGVDLNAAELSLAAAAGRGPLIQARADILPIPDNTATAICSALSLQLLTPLDSTLAEFGRVLRPGGTLVALLPPSSGGRHGLLDWARIYLALGLRELAWPNPEIIKTPERPLRQHGFVITSDEQRTFVLDLTTPDHLRLIIDGLYLPDHTDHDKAKAWKRLSRWAPRGLHLPMPLRRIVAVHRP